LYLWYVLPFSTTSSYILGRRDVVDELFFCQYKYIGIKIFSTYVRLSPSTAESKSFQSLYIDVRIKIFSKRKDSPTSISSTDGIEICEGTLRLLSFPPVRNDSKLASACSSLTTVGATEGGVPPEADILNSTTRSGQGIFAICI